MLGEWSPPNRKSISATEIRGYSERQVCDDRHFSPPSATINTNALADLSGVSPSPDPPTPFEEPTVERTPERFTARGSFVFQIKKNQAPERWR